VADVTNPGSPVLLGSINTPYQALAAAVSGNSVYVADGDGGLQILPAQCETPTPVLITTPLASALSGSFPNPFSTQTSIEYTLGERSRVLVNIYDVSGRLVARLDDGERDAGMHVVEWDGRDDNGNAVGSGVYFYRLEGIRGVAAKKMIRLK
jgi:hypothetical protein